MEYIDLHTHTRCSDGTYTPEALVAAAMAKNLKALAITDHDTISGLSAARQAVKGLPIQLISGVEISIMYHETELHILGLFIDETNGVLNYFLNDMRKNRRKRNMDMAKGMAEKGLKVSYQALLDQAGNPDVITRAHFANVLVENGHAATKKEAFQQYLSKGCSTYLRRILPEPGAAINAIHSAGGYAVLAHPIQYGYTKETLKKALMELKTIGLDGIEAIYTTHQSRDEQLYRRLAEMNGLKITGGSDFHGANKPDIALGTGFGNLRIPYTILEQFY